MTIGQISPRWSTTTKLIVSLLTIVIIAALVWQFQKFIGPILFAFLLSYLLHPLAGFISKKVKFSWRAASTLLYLFIFLVIIGLLTWGGFSLVQPLQSLITFLQTMLTDVPGILSSLTSQPLTIGTMTIDLSKFHNPELWTQLQSVLSPALSKMATLLGEIAAGAASIVTMTIFTILISYFITVESTGVRSELITLQIPNYQEDIQRFSKYLSRIWSSYLRGQMIIFTMTVIFYTILLSILGVNYAFALALMAGFARFIPYVGPFITWTTYGLVCLFQGSTIFNLMPFPYALIVVGVALVTDIIMDNFVSPRIMSNALGVHPALVLVSVLVAANLLGVVGVLIAAPAVASLKLILTYVFRKLTDQDPWKDIKLIPAPVPLKMLLAHWGERIAKFIAGIGKFIHKLFHRKDVKS